eukprot:tig00001085_g6946.t1
MARQETAFSLPVPAAAGTEAPLIATVASQPIEAAAVARRRQPQTGSAPARSQAAQQPLGARGSNIFASVEQSSRVGAKSFSLQSQRSNVQDYVGLATGKKLRLGKKSREATAALRQALSNVGVSVAALSSPQWNRPTLESTLAEPTAENNIADPSIPYIEEERDACGVGFVAETQNPASHLLIKRTLEALTCMEHRGGCSADRDSGDGAGVMTAIPWELFEDWFKSQGKPAPSSTDSGVGQIFLPKDPEAQKICRDIVEKVAKEEGFTVLAWRDVPVDESVLGVQAKENVPKMEQVFLSKSVSGHDEDELERQLYLVRRRIEKAVDATRAEWALEFYPVSLSHRTIVYKGMVRSEVLGKFYKDLTNELYKSSWASYHRRFSTNTMPKWRLAQPFRFLCHNGEINTLQGNMNWLHGREPAMKSELWGERVKDLLPIGRQENSDSGNMDNALEMLVRSGRPAPEACMMMIPEAYRNHPELSSKAPEVIDFFEYYSGLQEAWDGPALVVFSDGKTMGATLDRNGLRPARYCKTKDGLVFVGSEVGVVSIPQEDIVFKGRLGPGQMLAVDLVERKVLENFDIKKRIAAQRPYGEWVKNHRETLSAQQYLAEPDFSETEILRWQTSLGYSAEDVEMVLEHMAMEGHEPTFCMGDDIPLAALSEKQHVIYDYFKQRFAQVTNPAIDPLREGLVMSLSVALGNKGNILETEPIAADHLLQLDSPFLNENELAAIQNHPKFKVGTFETRFDISSGPASLEAAIKDLTSRVCDFVKNGGEIIVLSDRPANGQLEELKPIIPPMMACGAVHHALIKAGLRNFASIVLETGQCWSTHHFACLVGYGASAICPYMALSSVRQWRADPKTETLMKRGKIKACTAEEAQANFKHAIEAGLLKILSKIGISLLSSYLGAQIFECFGLGKDAIDMCFTGTYSRIGGLSLEDTAREIVAIHQRAFPSLTSRKLENLGFIQYRPNAEYHHNNPDVAKAIHKMVRDFNQDNVQAYRDLVRSRPTTTLRDLMDIKSDRQPIPIDQVEPASSIMRRFCTGGMSLGALSRECHEVIAIGMNRIGGKSNSGEGGEDPERYKVLDDVDGEGNSSSVSYLKGLQNGDTASSAIKQIASGRFGVTPEYLMSAKYLEIKIAQGAKPGEGGQLPGKKISSYIAQLRRSKPGVTLISPPPHHDIYSIEDLAQLIYDLHQINEAAKVSVKLVSEIGIGTVAAGVAKANADVIQISGHDGGTGASPISSIKHAGGPWEMGLSEVQRVLLENGLRDRVVLRVDGGFKTGNDVLVGALMGGDEYGFGSIAMIATGCIMARVCHTNNCPVGVASQREDLRQRFPGVPGDIVNFFMAVAEETRELLASMGYRSLDEVIGRVDLLKPRDGLRLAKTDSVSLDYLLSTPVPADRSWVKQPETAHSNGPVLDDEILADQEIKTAIESHGTVNKTIKITNVDRSVGARVSGQIAVRYGDRGFKGKLNLNFVGAAGQSFGAFIVDGMRMRIEGECNDYVGKGMNGGEIIVVPPSGSSISPSESVIVGNTCLYGSTGGRMFAYGRAGERFGVRNSLGTAVVEGTGDHCCEYMTGGTIVVLGPVGRNVGAGMTGGLAYFLDEDGSFPEKVNTEIVRLQRVQTDAGKQALKQLITDHVAATGSKNGQRILDNWETMLPKFWQAVPPSEAYNPQVSEEQPASEAVAA